MAPTRSQRARELPLDRIQRIAEFRAQLRAFTSRSDDVARRWALTPQRYLLLLMVAGAPDGTGKLSLTEIAERLHLSSNAATELVTRAEELGLVRRAQAAHDHRVVFVSATAEGKKRLVGAIEENERARSELNAAFARLARSFRDSA
jgi:DNA-binding MarR family transcriptional regulator